MEQIFFIFPQKVQKHFEKKKSLLRAKIEKENGDKIGAKASAEKCIALATAAKNDDYIKQGNDLIKKLQNKLKGKIQKSKNRKDG